MTIEWPTAAPSKPELPELEPPEELIEVGFETQAIDPEYFDSQHDKRDEEEIAPPPEDDTEFVGLLQEICDTLWDVESANKVETATQCLNFIKSITMTAEEPSEG